MRKKNLPVTPEIVSHSFYISVWWKCEKGHTWQTQLKSRSALCIQCPECYEEEHAARRKKERVTSSLYDNKKLKNNIKKPECDMHSGFCVF